MASLKWEIALPAQSRRDNGECFRYVLKPEQLEDNHKTGTTCVTKVIQHIPNTSHPATGDTKHVIRGLEFSCQYKICASAASANLHTGTNT